MEKDFLITNPARIAWVLQSLRDDHQLVDVGFRGRDTGARSIIVDIDSAAGYFTLDGFPNQDCHRLAGRGEKFDLRASLNGVDVMVSSLQVSEVRDEADGALYCVALPTQLRYVQRRDTYRAQVTGLAEVAVTAVNQESAETYSGYLADISADGCRVALDGDENAGCGRAGERYQLTLQMPEGDALSLCVTSRHSRFVARSGLWYVGCCFEQPAPALQQRIERFVAEMQLKARQREAMFAA
ncbi:flagellar brake protein [Granulosicoccaceae sp. 1_MG-2023]|nr:flagellar brake protein [Granulosicoccaceae sp. 1_MG-2023]